MDWLGACRGNPDTPRNLGERLEAVYGDPSHMLLVGVRRGRQEGEGKRGPQEELPYKFDGVSPETVTVPA